MQPARPNNNGEASALAAVYRLLRELGKRRLALRADADEPVAALPRLAHEMQDEEIASDDGGNVGTVPK